MGGAPIVDEQWIAGGAAPAATSPAPARPAVPRPPRPARAAVAAEEVRLAVPVVWVGTLAEQEARDLGHHRVGTEHLLLALVRLGDPMGRRLTGHGAGLEKVRRIVERDGPPGAMDNANGRPGWSTAATAAVRAARLAAGADGRHEVSGRDLLTAMLAPAGRAAVVLADLGVDAEAVLADPGPARVAPQQATPPVAAPRAAPAPPAIPATPAAPPATDPVEEPVPARVA